MAGCEAGLAGQFLDPGQRPRHWGCRKVTRALILDVMTKTTKSLLGFAIATLIIGFLLNAGVVKTFDLDALYTLLPLGAVFFGLFLIARVLEGEVQTYDSEHKSPPHGGAQAVRH